MEDINALTRFTPQEQVAYEKEQTLYSIIKTMEFLEFAYMTGKIKGNDYDQECRQMLHQFSVCSGSIPGFVGLDAFIAQMNLGHCQSAVMRIKEGKSNYKGEETDKNLAQRVMQIT